MKMFILSYQFMNDDEEIKFVVRVYDVEGYPDEFSINDVVKIIKNSEG